VPTYGYECAACKEQFEVVQKITDAPLTTHEGCGGRLRRLLYPVGIVFKGPGFHVNDYARKGGNGASDAASEGKSETKSESKPEPAAAKT
jgi:putative FmdB family regulatory protein